MSTDKASNERPEPEVLDTIVAFEALLESMPDDVSTLDALLHSCLLAKDTGRIRRYLVQLARIHLRQNRLADAQALLPELRAQAKDSPEITALIKEIESQESESAEEPAPLPALNETELRQSTLQSELAFAWYAHDRQLLTREEYAQMVQDLTELASNPMLGTTVSLQHALKNRERPNVEHMLATVTRDAHISAVPVSHFDTPPAVAQLLPMTVIRIQGVVPFERIGAEVLIALLNPFNDRLRAEISASIGARCHFYLTTSTEFDRWVEKQTALAASAESATPA